MTDHLNPLFIALIACGLAVSGCGGRAYVYQPIDEVNFRSHAEEQSAGLVRVTASVLGREETSDIFGLSLYDQRIQPVWLEIENKGAVQIRYAPVGTDRLYFSPLEVAYKNRGGYSAEARAEMERRFDKLAMPRYIDAGEIREGFVFTHADFGAKAFNVDLFGSGDSLHFTFLMGVPGFVPDYANIDFDSLYAADEIKIVAGEDMYEAVKSLACCITDESDAEGGDPSNIVLIGAGEDLLRALLRSGWIETSVEDSIEEKSQYSYGRPQDAIFRYHSLTGSSFYELRLWLAPLMFGDYRVWTGQVQHFFHSRSIFNRPDPDIDNARSFALQNLLYGQSLKALGWIAGEAIAPVESFWENRINASYFSDGYQVVLWLSGDPVSLVDTAVVDWDRPPGWNR
jgi:hypothetical protein